MFPVRMPSNNWLLIACFNLVLTAHCYAINGLDTMQLKANSPGKGESSPKKFSNAASLTPGGSMGLRQGAFAFSSISKAKPKSKILLLAGETCCHMKRTKL